MEKLIEDVLINLLQLLGAGVLSLVGYYVYHSATYKRIEKIVLAVEKKSPVLDKLIEAIKSDAEKLLASPEAKDATAQAIVNVLEKHGIKDITIADVQKEINTLESNGQEVIKDVQK